MPDPHEFPFLREILLFLILAGVLIPALQRLRLNQVLGFIAVGALLGPLGLGSMADLGWQRSLTFPAGPGVSMLAEVGVLFLMFMIGLELSGARMWALRRWVFGAGIAQVTASAAIIGGALALAGMAGQTAAILGLVLSLSSTAVVMQLLNQRHAGGTPLGDATLSILMLQDLAVIPILILVGALARDAGGTGAEPGMVALLALGAMAKAGLAIGVIYLVGGRVIHPVFRTFARQRQPDVFMALVLLATFGLAALSAALGLSMALGALIAGLLLAESEFRHEIELMIEPFKGLLMGLFFMSVGMTIDMRQIVEEPLWLAAGVAGLLLVKGVVVALVMRIGGLPWARAVEGGFLLGQGGEFAFVVIGSAVAARVLEPRIGSLVTLAVGLSLFTTPLLARLGSTVSARLERRHRDAPTGEDEQALGLARGHAIVAGFGRVGQQIGKLLKGQDIPFIAFETDAELVVRMRADGWPVWFGDATRPDLLRRLYAGEAPLIVLTMDQPVATMHAVSGIRRDFPHVRLFVRSRDEKHARRLRLAGASVVVPETLEASLQLSSFVLEELGLDAHLVGALVDRERAVFAAELPQAAEAPQQAVKRRHTR